MHDKEKQLIERFYTDSSERIVITDPGQEIRKALFLWYLQRFKEGDEELAAKSFQATVVAKELLVSHLQKQK